ncbi:hypothetical protein PCC7424_1865 [Gloeothece citriformis PCC 7424]|uniref:Type II secretion system protein n=1 Tax=Gloeothece citriformis (strain PCC 7424) TaxID=65393 RepID=B7KDJ5_GLOC7|nr:prepilin-type N-terminal cleavage/methylation domain-containing protein [Gloeothece citriformis]ACK70297.1 hypothetical protein PCC7424_1865 [Gloeothece citriformis PCC 7424]
MKKPLNFTKKLKINTDNNQGFTLVEALAGITVAGMVFAAVAPVIMIGISTRLQTQKAQQAIEIAQGEVNRIQTLMAQGVNVDDEDEKLPPVLPSEVDTQEELIAVQAPESTVDNFAELNSSDSSNGYKKAYLVELNNQTAQPDFLVQVFRDEGIRFQQGRINGQLAVFRVGIRVYSGLAKDNIGNLETDVASLQMTESFGQQRTRPLAVIYTEISQSDAQFSLQEYEEYLDED